VTALLVVSLIVGAFVLTNRDSEPTKGTVPTEIEKVSRTISGKSSNEDRADSVKVLTEILNLALKSPTGATVAERVKALDDSDFSVIDKGLPVLIRFGPDADEAFKVNTYQSLIVMAATITENTKTDKVTPIAVDSHIFAWADSELGTVFVPLSTFMGEKSVFSFEMVFIDKAWRLSPYSLIDSIRLSATIQNSDRLPVPTTQPANPPAN
jgi:hypothetical protein